MNIMNYAATDVLTVQANESIDNAISLMEELELRHLVVATGGRAVGMLSDRDILISTGWMLSVERGGGAAGSEPIAGPARVEQIMSRSLITLTRDASARDAANLMQDKKIGAIPIMGDGRVIAIITESDLLRWLAELSGTGTAVDDLLRRPVSGLMRTRVHRVTPESPLEEVVDIFRRYRVRHVPVAVGKSLVGIISDRDVRRALAWSSARDARAEAKGRGIKSPFPAKASDVMQTSVKMIWTDSQVRKAVNLMLEHRIHSLPVVDTDGLAGIVTQTDILAAIAREEAL